MTLLTPATTPKESRSPTNRPTHYASPTTSSMANGTTPYVPNTAGYPQKCKGYFFPFPNHGQMPVEPGLGRLSRRCVDLCAGRDRVQRPRRSLNGAGLADPGDGSGAAHRRPRVRLGTVRRVAGHEPGRYR